MVVHVLMLLVLGLVTIADPIKIVNVLCELLRREGPEVEKFTIEEMDPGDISELEEEIVEPVMWLKPWRWWSLRQWIRWKSQRSISMLLTLPRRWHQQRCHCKPFLL